MGDYLNSHSNYPPASFMRDVGTAHFVLCIIPAGSIEKIWALCGMINTSITGPFSPLRFRSESKTKAQRRSRLVEMDMQ